MEEKQSPNISHPNVILEMMCFLQFLTREPLFSIFVTLYTLVLLYFPTLFFNLLFSPVLISTLIILSALLRLGSVQQIQSENFPNSPIKPLESVKNDEQIETKIEHQSETKIENFVAQNAYFSESFCEWNVRAPLEVIYEEEDDEGIQGKEDQELKQISQVGFNGGSVVPMAQYYTESSDSDSSSEGKLSGIEGWDSPENIFFRWDDDEEKDDLIEIELDGLKKSCVDFQFEEDNLIEIEISHGFN